MRTLLSLVTALSMLVALPAQDDEYAKLVAEYERAKSASFDAAIAEFVPRFEAAAEAHAGKDAAVPYLTWIVRNGMAGAAAGKALETLTRSHAKSLDLGPVLDIVPNLAAHLGDGPCTKFLDAALEASGPPELQAKAMFAHAVICMQQTKDVDDTMLAMAERALTIAKKLTKDRALAAALERTAIARRGLAIGDVAPEVAGFDLDGAPLRLSDFRGRVVVLTFWGSWCGPSRAMLPHERTLVERLKDKPFTLLGVNSDKDLAALRPMLATEKITWRNFWNGGGTNKCIAERFGVRAWPTIYILDQKGVVRFTNRRGEQMDAAVDELLAEMEKEKPAAGK